MIDSNAEALSANSSSLLKQSLWCGAVCAVAIVLTSLNLCPPVDVKYKVTTRVVVSKHRLEQLKSTLERDRKIIATGKLRYVQLYSLKLLDEVERDGLLLVELESLWTGRASPTHIETWLTKVSQTDPSKLIASDEARTERFARWEAETAKHYLKHHRFVCVNADVELDATEQIAKEPASSGGIPPSLLRRLQPMQSPPSWSPVSSTSTIPWSWKRNCLSRSSKRKLVWRSRRKPFTARWSVTLARSKLLESLAFVQRLLAFRRGCLPVSLSWLLPPARSQVFCNTALSLVEPSIL